MAQGLCSATDRNATLSAPFEFIGVVSPTPPAGRPANGVWPVVTPGACSRDAAYD